ncbi:MULTISPECIES: hypothetical protein [unclassified Streptomyces]|uniref:hypothetical protein n=1 Tax=unclassified Streptomyces TaxID=2593676 RepID=UPI000978EA67|nr:MULTISPECIES: hypothetical protein [unclassified Streptomyces]ONI48647.1 hypothetical protein STIB_72010 [Streptomyces sp. IB2014 011-1]RDV48181.1 hypothetical protein DDV98_28850 [Streptomyces sp. IB2014 011-12]
MADQHFSVPSPRDGTRPPWYARTATTVGRPAVLTATLIMSMPGEYKVAKLAGWSDPWAYGMPFALSAYAGIAAVVTATRPKGARGRLSAQLGAAFAIILALAAQVVAHLVQTGHMNGNQAWLIAITSMVPPAVLAHLLHLAATPTPVADPSTSVDVPVVERVASPVEPAPVAVPPMPEQAPPPPAIEAPTAPAAIQYRDPRCATVRPLYDGGARPGTAAMRDALIAAGHGRVGDSTIRGTIRAEIEEHEPHLAALPPALGRTA